jgi:heat-inducible transcriptional repressor
MRQKEVCLLDFGLGPDLEERKFRILQAIIDDYILTASPVGSRTISRKYEQKLSSATIRNEMSDLEELGYLASPHTSAGRVPSAKAYRLYVDRFMHLAPLSPEEAEHLRGHFDRRMRQVHAVAQRAAQALSDATNYASVIVTQPTQPPSLRIQHIQIVPVSAGLALMLLVTDSGTVKQTLLHLSTDYDIDDLYRISRILSEQLAGRKLEDAPAALRRVSGEWNDAGVALMEALRGACEQITDEPQVQPEVVVGGSANLLRYPEYSDVEKARELLLVLETKEKLMQLLRHGPGMEFTVRIGPETGMPETVDCSVVTGTYRLGDTLGTIGVIGPTRMQYQKVIAVLDYVGRTFARILDDNG